MRVAAVLSLLGGAILAMGVALAGAAEGLPSEWNPFWARESGAGQAAADTQVTHDGKPTIRVEHRGKDDWSLTRKERLPVEPGDMFQLDVWLKVDGQGSATPCAIAYGKDGKAVDWALGERTTRAAADWQRVRSRFVVPAGTAEIAPRVIGYGPATAWVEGFSCVKQGSVKAMRGPDMPAAVVIGNAAIAVTFRTDDGTLAVIDKRTGQTWSQKPLRPDVIVKSAKAAGRIEAEILDAASMLDIKVAIALDGDRPELVVSLVAEGELARSLSFPHPFVSDAGTYLVVPMNEGISYPVDDASIGPMHLIAYGGHGISMAFFGVTDGARGQMAILETPDDASIRIDRAGGRLCIAPLWDSQKGRVGYERRLRYVFLDKGGHVAMAKRYREYARQIGLFKTLEEKCKDVPAVDLLVGAVNVWCWDKDAPAIVREMQAAGIDRILWSNAQSPENLRALNEMPGVLTSRYDIYQDAMNPANFPLLRYRHGDWTSEGWPKDMMIDARGDWIRGWEIEGKDGKMYPCGVLCDRQAPAYADRRIPEDLKTHPYRSRFIDTTTASPWRECYSLDHPLTRSESRRSKMDLLALVSGKYKLVTGCETGHDASVPYLHYFEGMLSLGPYRVPDSGRDMQRIVTEVPEPVAKFQLGHAYRLPLWELVYHDCVVSQWYWGDYNNKLPALWDKRDLFNALYGTPPMFMFRRDLWTKEKDRFVASYRATG
ncbi:MAG: carbohydrate binding domain-containing protein, partial [Planctomycetes bacterium]|nr:carbohydrate binding domain-containing protein [Planctomycetota bacterium]